MKWIKDGLGVVGNTTRRGWRRFIFSLSATSVRPFWMLCAMLAIAFGLFVVRGQNEGETRIPLLGNGVGGCDLRIENGVGRFGDVELGAESTQPVFLLKNMSATASCEVFGIETTAPYFSATYLAPLPDVIPPGGAVEHFADVTFRPAALGSVEAEIVLRWRTKLP